MEESFEPWNYGLCKDLMPLFIGVAGIIQDQIGI